jgi:hypothetical protein
MRMFRSRNEWFAHELQYHRRESVCHFCQHDAFPTAEMFSKHVISSHPSILADSKIEAVVLQSEEPVAKIPSNACPLCNEWETSLRESKQDSKRLRFNGGRIVQPFGNPKQFRRHLGRHMEQLALFALPVKESDVLEDESLDEQDEDYADPGDEEDLLEPESKNLDAVGALPRADGPENHQHSTIEHGSSSLTPSQWDSQFTTFDQPDSMRWTPITLGWTTSELLNLYEFVVPKSEEPYFELEDR